MACGFSWDGTEESGGENRVGGRGKGRERGRQERERLMTSLRCLVFLQRVEFERPEIIVNSQ
jgi:hypothetical protein